MLESLMNYKQQNRAYLYLAIAFGFLAFGAVTFGYYYYIQALELANNRIFYTDRTGQFSVALVGTGPESAAERELEYRHHVTQFMKRVYEYDERTFETNLKAGLELVQGASGRELYEYQKKTEILRSLQQYDFHMTCQVDSIRLVMNQVPVVGEVYATQTKHQLAGQQARRIVATFNLRDLGRRTEKNLNGVLIENYKPRFPQVVQPEE